MASGKLVVDGGVQHRMPAAFVLHLVRLLARWDIPARKLLAGFRIDEARLAEPWASLPSQTVCALLDRARTLTGEPGLGFYLGLRRRATGYGYPGFAVMSAQSYEQALKLAIQFVPVLTTTVSLRLEVEGDLSSLVVHEHADAGNVQDILLIGLLVALRQVGADITGGTLNASIELAIPEPAYYRRFEHLVPHMRFAQSLSRLVFETSALSLPLVMSDPAALRLAGEECERALEALGPQWTLVASVRRALAQVSFGTMRDVAAELSLSPRTLARRLAAKGQSFGQLLDTERQQKAMRLLRVPHLSIDDVAEKLGYSSVSNFTRAFHRWTGLTPAAYRRERVAAFDVDNAVGSHHDNHPSNADTEK